MGLWSTEASSDCDDSRSIEDKQRHEKQTCIRNRTQIHEFQKSQYGIIERAYEVHAVFFVGST